MNSRRLSIFMLFLFGFLLSIIAGCSKSTKDPEPALENGPVILSRFLANKRTLQLPANEDGTRTIHLQCSKKIFKRGGKLELITKRNQSKLPLQMHQSLDLKPGKHTIRYTYPGGWSKETWEFQISERIFETYETKVNRGLHPLPKTTGTGILKSVTLINSGHEEAARVRLAGKEGMYHFSRKSRLEYLQNIFWEASTLEKDGTYNVEGGIKKLFLNQLHELPDQPGASKNGWRCMPFHGLSGYDYCGGQAFRFCKDFLNIMDHKSTCYLAFMQAHTLAVPCTRGNLKTGECFFQGTVDLYHAVIPGNQLGEMVPPSFVKDPRKDRAVFTLLKSQQLGDSKRMKDFFDAMATYEKSNLREIYPLDCEDSPSGGWPIPPGGKFQWTMESTGFHFPASCIEDGSCGGTYRLGSIRISVPVNSTRLYEWGYSITGYNAWIVEFTNVPQEGSFAAEISIGDQGLGVMNWTIPAGNSQLDLSDLLLNNENIINFIGMNVKALPGGNVIVTAYSQTNGQFQPLIDADHLEFLTDWEKGPEFLELEIQRDTAVDSIGQVAIFYDRDEIRKNGLDPLFFKLNVLQKDSTLKYSRGHRIELRAKNETGISFFRPKNFTRRYPGQPNSDWIPLGEDVTCKENATYWMLLAKPNAPSIIDVELFIDGSKMSFLANKGKKRMVVDSLKIKTK